MQPFKEKLPPHFTRLEELLLSAGCTRASIGSRIIALLFSGVFFAGGVAILYFATLSPLVKYLESRHWQQTGATITGSKLDWDDDSARVDIRYEYRINGTDHAGDRYDWSNQRTNFGIGEKEKIIDRYKIGTRVKIWFDPNDPTESIINRSQTGISGISLLFPIPFLLVGVCGLCYALLGGCVASRTRKLLGSIAAEAESQGFVSLVKQLRDPPSGRSRSRKLIFTMAQSKVEGLGLLFAAIFWNGIVSVFLCVLISLIRSGEKTAIFLGLFLIPFVIIGVLIAFTTFATFRLPRPPAYVFAFSGLDLTGKATEIHVKWMRLVKGGRLPDATNLRLGIGRDLAENPITFGKATDSLDGIPMGWIEIHEDLGESAITLKAVSDGSKNPAGKSRKDKEIGAVFEWEEQPRRERRSARWSLIAADASG